MQIIRKINGRKCLHFHYETLLLFHCQIKRFVPIELLFVHKENGIWNVDMLAGKVVCKSFWVKWGQNCWPPPSFWQSLKFFLLCSLNSKYILLMSLMLYIVLYLYTMLLNPVYLNFTCLFSFFEVHFGVSRFYPNSFFFSI